jgi:hypothetical protein
MTIGMVQDRFDGHRLGSVSIVPKLDVVASNGKPTGINNQGRVRPDNLPPIEANGVHYRSHAERRLTDAFLTLGFVVKPLPLVLYRDGNRIRRLEPDIEVIVQGRSVAVEIDGPWHTETPADAQARLERLRTEGVVIERVRARDCDTDAQAMETAKRLASKWGLPWRH